MAQGKITLDELNERSREVFHTLVQNYLQTGDPVGSRTLSRSIVNSVSSATIRNVMQDLEILGLLKSPHTSAGRVPTEQGLRLFVDGFMEVGQLAKEERDKIETLTDIQTNASSDLFDGVGSMLSGLTQTASLVLAPKTEIAIKHIEFVSLSLDRALVILVMNDGTVENRVFEQPLGQTSSSMREAANFINSMVAGKTLSELKKVINVEIENHRQNIDALAQNLIEAGLANWSLEGNGDNRLIVRGRSNLIDDLQHSQSLEKIRSLFDELETKKDLAQILELTQSGEGVRVFIGSENKLFSLSGSTLVVSPYMNSDRKVIGAVGVIGPTRLNYGRIVPIVDYTAQLVGQLMALKGKG